MKSPRPVCILAIQFERGIIKINSPLTRAQLEGILKDDEVMVFKDVDVALAGNAQTKQIEYIIVNNEVTINRRTCGPILYYSIAETKDPPKIDTTAGGLIRPDGRPI